MDGLGSYTTHTRPVWDCNSCRPMDPPGHPNGGKVCRTNGGVWVRLDPMAAVELNIHDHP